MPEKMPLAVNYSQQDASLQIVPNPPLLTSHKSNWKNIYLVHYQLPPGETPEICSPQHTIVIPRWKQTTVAEVSVEGCWQQIEHQKDEMGCIEILPAELPLRANWNQQVEVTHCYLEPKFLAQIAYESVDPDRVELKMEIKKADPLIWQIGLALKAVLESNEGNDYFYVESMATALSAHLLRYYSIRKPNLQEYEGGLPKYQLKQAIEYINDHLAEDLSLTTISAELGISQFHFCRLFKQSTGITPHKYLIQQRVERAKQLLKQAKGTITSIAVECGFANHSHFAKYFRQHTGVSPKQFRKI